MCLSRIVPTSERAVVKGYKVFISGEQGLTFDTFPSGDGKYLQPGITYKDSLSDSMVDAPIKYKVHLFREKPLTFSSVVTSGVTCLSSQQGNKCLDCRDCWNPHVKVVSYKKH